MFSEGTKDSNAAREKLLPIDGISKHRARSSLDNEPEIKYAMQR
jgi:hypothetical protein